MNLGYFLIVENMTPEQRQELDDGLSGVRQDHTALHAYVPGAEVVDVGRR